MRWSQKFNVEAAQFDTFSVNLREVATPTNAVRMFQHLGATMTDNVGNPAVAVEEAAGWGQVTARADALAGLNVEFAANLVSDNTVVKAGLGIDDVSVTACRAASADLSITKTDGVTTVTAGGSTTYTITAGNAGPSAAGSVTAADTFPASLTCTWTCAGAGGGTCAAAGSGSINDTASLPAGGSVTYTAACTIGPGATGSIVNTATATVGGGVVDPNPAGNSATDTDTVTPAANLGITKTDGATQVAPGGTLSYTIVASNPGPSGVTGATVADTFPASCTSVSWACSGTGTCPANGTGAITALVDLPVGTQVTNESSGVSDEPGRHGRGQRHGVRRRADRPGAGARHPGPAAARAGRVPDRRDAPPRAGGFSLSTEPLPRVARRWPAKPRSDARLSCSSPIPDSPQKANSAARAVLSAFTRALPFGYGRTRPRPLTRP
ncbi:MAG TPA: hypothetical protein VLF18_21465 [Tahibacter sp.]|uniref:hypothetical protein n=1 Tax=Tahibacter sp. TaxID=2056211 RepID=UPI002CE257CB|nr:hypothetical protein [Tahibacter sp.]HSX62760.1 hypothetical protein [Tahibacter sp.]